MDKKSEQILRKLKFIAEARKNNYPNAESFAKKLARYEGEDGQPFGCSARTIARDIKDLIQVHNAPLAYDALNRGYYLVNQEWEFQCPIFQDDFISMALLGTQLASKLLPEPLSNNMDTAMAQTLANNRSEFFDTAMIESILCASGIKNSIPPELFQKIFDAWRLKQAVTLTYRKPTGEEYEYLFEPHIIAFHRGTWYAKGYRYQSKEIRLYAIQRITGIQTLGDNFESDKELLALTRKNGLFNYSKIEGIVLHCEASIAFYIYEQQKVFHSKIERQDDDSLLVRLNPTIEHEVIRWILAEAGKIQVIEPLWLREKIVEAAKNIVEANS